MSVFLEALGDEILKLAEFAPGIPAKEESHELPRIPLEQEAVWEFGVHDHRAEKRGRHFDLRLGDPETGQAHSWALGTEWPKPGERTWAIQQPTHTLEYMDFKGSIPEGYGAGKVRVKTRDQVEVVNAQPGHVTFNRYTGKGPEEYTLHRIGGKQWILFNRTFDRRKMKDIPDYKPKYKEQKPGQVDWDSDDLVMSAKYDDAHNLFLFPRTGEPVRVISYKKGKRGRDVIEHTHKVPTISTQRTPKSLRNTIVRGGIYAMDVETGKATPATRLAGMLNSNVWKSREQQKQYGELRPVLYDVVRHRGKNMENAPYEEKLKVLQQVVDEMEGFELPRMAWSKEEKDDFFKAIEKGEIPETQEGVVLWNLKSGERPVKVKFTNEHDVVIRGFVPGKGKHKGKGVGAFTYSHEPGGPVVGRVGTGLSDAQRRDMHETPEKYLGAIARVEAQEKYPSGALRGPRFLDFHLDKNDQEILDQLLSAEDAG